MKTRFPDRTEALSVYAAGVLKRWAESGLYDRITRTALFGRAKASSTPVKYLLEAALNYLGAAAEVNIPENGPAAQVVRRLVQDAPSELAWRLFDGPPKPTEDPGGEKEN